MDVPLEILDRQVARAEAELEAGRARLANGDAAHEAGDASNPLAAHRRVSERTTWQELGSRTESLAAPLRAWIYALTLDRVLWPDTVRLATAWHAPSITVAETGIAALTESPRALLVRMLREPDASRRRIFARALAQGTGAVHDAARILADRRVEAARLLGADPDAIGAPRRSSRRPRRGRCPPARRHGAPRATWRTVVVGPRDERRPLPRRGLAGSPRAAVAPQSLPRRPAHRRPPPRAPPAAGRHRRVLVRACARRVRRGSRRRRRSGGSLRARARALRPASSPPGHALRVAGGQSHLRRAGPRSGPRSRPQSSAGRRPGPAGQPAPRRRARPLPRRALTAGR